MTDSHASEFDDLEAQIAARDAVVARDEASFEAAAQTRVAAALVGKGIRLAKLGRPDEAVACFDHVVAQYGAATGNGLRLQVALALGNKAYRLFQAGGKDEAHTTLDDLIARFADDPDPDLRKQVALAFYNKAQALEEAGYRADAVAVADELDTRFGDDPAPALRQIVADGLAVKALALAGIALQEEGIAVYDEIVERYGHAPDPELRFVVATSLSRQANLVRQHNRAGAIEILDDVLHRFDHDTIAPELRPFVINALVVKGHILEQLNRKRDAIATYRALLQRFPPGDAPDDDKSIAWVRGRYAALTDTPRSRLGRRVRRLI